MTKRQLNQQTAGVLALVDAGESVAVTERGVVRWRIDPVDPVADPLARLRAQGRLTPPKPAPMPWAEDDADPDPARVERLHAQMRDDRR